MINGTGWIGQQKQDVDVDSGGRYAHIDCPRSLSSDRPHVLVSPMRVATNGAMSCGMGSHTLPHSQVGVGKAWGVYFKRDQ